jgi:hypothetical protein
LDIGAITDEVFMVREFCCCISRQGFLLNDLEPFWGHPTWRRLWAS